MPRAEAAALTPSQVLARLGTAADGLSEVEARARLLAGGHNLLPHTGSGALHILARQFTSALVYILLVACVLAFVVGDLSDGVIILAILLINTALGFFQEFRAEQTVEQLSKLISREQMVVRSGGQMLVDVGDLVPGDIIQLRAGDIVPADAKLLKTEDLQVNEAPLTGESVAVDKAVGTKDKTKAGRKSQSADNPSSGEGSLLFAGCTITRGEGTAVIYATGTQTALGGIAALSTSIHRVTAYEQALQGFSTLLLRIIGLSLGLVLVGKLLVIGIGGSSAAGTGARIPSLLLFVIALAVAVVPEALPVIATVTLSRGALRLAHERVVVKRLSAVEDLGNITLLCTDKTGTLTENRMAVERVTAEDEPLFLRLACAALETQQYAQAQGGETKATAPDAFDTALLAAIPPDIKAEAAGAFRRLKEVPFDPEARRRRVLVEDRSSRPPTTYLLVLGSVETLLSLAACAHAGEWQAQVRADGEQGLRHLALAYAELHDFTTDGFDILRHEDHLQLLGFVTLSDPLRPSTGRAVQLARQLGVTLKILSGDSAEVVGYVARQVGLLESGAAAPEPEAAADVVGADGASRTQVHPVAESMTGSTAGPATLASTLPAPVRQRVLTGDELDAMSAEARRRAIEEGVAFARVSPTQKFAIIQTLQQAHYVVGYQGDGINDAPPLKLADVGIAVDTATDVAKANADIILLQKDLAVIVNGIRYGRAIFANINKYINYTMVGNFGNFFALAALFLLSGTLPLLPRQVLLISLLTDVPLVAVATDTVAADETARPAQYDPHALMFMSLLLGSLTALFELAFFATLQTHPSHAATFIETALYLFLTWTQLAVIFSVRTRGHIWQAQVPSRPLIGAMITTFLVALALPYFGPLAAVLGFTRLPLGELVLIAVLVLLYLAVLDIVKTWYFELIHRTAPRTNLIRPSR